LTVPIKDWIAWRDGKNNNWLLQRGHKMSLLDHFVPLAFAVIYPAYGFLAYKKIKPDLEANVPGVRLRDYRETTVWLWLLCLLAMLAWIRDVRSFADLGLGLPAGWLAWVGIAIAVILMVLLISQKSKITQDQEQRQSLRQKLERNPASAFLPRTGADLKGFVLLSITAGICEEILFRGYLIWYLNQFSGTVLAVIFSSLLFGAAHSYQGWHGGVQAGVMGLILASVYVFTGTLWIPILLHIGGDIYSGTLGRIAYEEVKSDPSPV